MLLRAFLSRGGDWRMKTSVATSRPRYLAMLKAYEDKRFDDHFGVDPFAHGARGAAIPVGRARRLGRLDAHHAGGAAARAAQASRHLRQAVPDGARRPIGGALFQGRDPFLLSDAGAVRRQPRRRARGLAFLFRQAGEPDRSGGSRAAGGAAAIAGEAAPRPPRHRRRQRPRQGAERAWSRKAWSARTTPAWR